jgi:RNA polymerase sigma-70 factor (ECF subfamily)
MRNPGEDLALIARCKRELPHQHKAFEQLVSAYKDMVYTLCYRMTGSSIDAEDLLQEILTKLFLSLNKFEERSAFSSWLYRVTYNHCLNFLSSRHVEQARTDALPVGDVIVDTSTEASRQDQRTQAVLASIDPDDRALLVMKYVMDLDVKEISEILQIGLSATKMRLSRAKEGFKQMFKGAQ